MAPGETYEYEVLLGGEKRWLQAGSPSPHCATPTTSGRQERAGRTKALLLEIEEAVREGAASGGTYLEPEGVREFERCY